MKREEIKQVQDECYDIYQKSGYVAVLDHVDDQKRIGNTLYQDVIDEQCTDCDNDFPSLEHICLVCGSPTTPIPVHEDKSYFKIIAQGFDEKLQREEIEISCGENGKLFLIKTDEGFIVDVYNKEEDNIESLIVWEYELDSEDDECELDVVMCSTCLHSKLSINLFPCNECNHLDGLPKWESNVTHELCPKCEEEVQLNNEYVIQTCPICNEKILPCSICPDRICDKCPLEK